MKYILELSVFINRIDIPLKFRPKSNFPLECGLYERIDFLLNISPEMEFPFKNCKFSWENSFFTKFFFEIQFFF